MNALPSLHLNKRLGSGWAASAQQVWRGVGSRPTWRVLAYSGEVPPRRRALVLVDAVSGEVVEHLVEDNVEEAGEDA